MANYEKIIKDLNEKIKDQKDLFTSEKEMILAEIASKDAIKSQMDQERQLMQIQIDQKEEQI